jgi:ABC-type Na+ efflux pump permease subunit
MNTNYLRILMNGGFVLATILFVLVVGGIGGGAAMSPGSSNIQSTSMTGYEASPLLGTSDDITYAVAGRSGVKAPAAEKTRYSNNYDFTFERRNFDGSLDVTFQTTDKTATSLGSSDDIPYAVFPRLKSDAVGNNIYGGSYDFALVRYEP